MNACVKQIEERNMQRNSEGEPKMEKSKNEKENNNNTKATKGKKKQGPEREKNRIENCVY